MSYPARGPGLPGIDGKANAGEPGGLVAYPWR